MLQNRQIKVMRKEFERKEVRSGSVEMTVEF